MLRKSVLTEENTLVKGLNDLQKYLRASQNEAPNPMKLVSPFLAILDESLLSGPYKIAALDALLCFVSCDMLDSYEPSYSTADTLCELVDVVTKCRVVQTDASVDDLVPLMIIQLLHAIMKNKIKFHLTNEAMWAIVDSCHAMVIQSDGAKKSGSLSHVAECALLDSVSSILCDSSNFSDHSSTLSFGLPCAMKVLGSFIRKLEKYAKDRDEIEAIRSKSFDALGDSFLDKESVEIVVTLKVIHSMLLAGGNLRLSGGTILKCPSLASMIRDDLGRCMVIIGSKRRFSSLVLLNILGLFTTLVKSMSPALRITVELFFVHIYLKALHQLRDRLYTIVSGSPPRNLYSIYSTAFSIEELEMIMESLSDLVSYDGFLSSLFISFDCDPIKPDLVRSLFEYMCENVRLALAVDGVLEGDLQVVARLSVQTLSLLSMTISQRSQSSGSSGITTVENNPKCIQEFKPLELGNISNYFSVLRQSKHILMTAASKFAEKPIKAINFLQSEDVLASPPSAGSVATFLRTAPSLPKESVGTFLGELGQDNTDEYLKSKKFHEDVLKAYVKSFELTGQSIVNCLRIFLSAFRLPGEAQQIDRILVAFSEMCHCQCDEGRSGVLENAEVAYLLCFSIIMLNTDRHNPNIREDRKMSMEQFVRNNTNYGQDVKQTRDLPRDFLESIYISIDTIPIRTEENDVSGAVTTEAWMDMQLQAEINPEKGMMVTTCCPPDVLAALTKNMSARKSLPSRTADLNGLEKRRIEASDLSQTTRILTRELLCANSYGLDDPIGISNVVFNAHWIVDKDIIESFWPLLLEVGISPFVRTQSSPSIQNEALGKGNYRSPAALFQAIDFLVVLLKLTHIYNLQNVTDSIVFLLADFSGILASPVTDYVLAALLPESTVQRWSGEHENDVEDIPKAFSSKAVYSVASRAALCPLLQVVRNNPSFIDKSMVLYWHILGTLRDSALLPPEIVMERDPDILPPGIREKFEIKISNIENGSSSVPEKPRQQEVATSSILSFQGLGEAIFGSSSSALNLEEQTTKMIVTERWDNGYGETRDVPPGDEMSGESTKSALAHLREVIGRCGVDEIVRNSKFLDDSSLTIYIQALIANIEGLGVEGEKVPTQPSEISKKVELTIESALNLCTSRLPPQSASSIAWLEMILADIALRNRDRFHLIWPALSKHYFDSLNSVSQVDYCVERKVVGLFKIAEKVVSRPTYSVPIIALLDKLFVLRSAPSPSLSQNAFNTLSDQISVCMWRFLTHNLSVLPHLNLEQWQTLFEIIACCGSVGGYSSIKAFETMAWLLHEQQLRAEVPVFCVIGIKPLLCNQNAPLSVSLGAVQLLNALHSRLEVLIKTTENNYAVASKELEDETPILWERCWYPVLAAFADASDDSREVVVNAAIDALSRAILDRHADAVPPQVLVHILQDIFIPTVLQLGESLYSRVHVSDVSRDSPKASVPIDSKEDIGSEGASNEATNIGTTLRKKILLNIASGNDEVEQLSSIAAVKCLQALCQTFVKHFPRFIHLGKSFENLWISVLRLLGFFLGAPQGFDCLHILAESSNRSQSAQDFVMVIEAAKGDLEKLLVSANSLQIFSLSVNENGKDLWNRTGEIISHFQHCPSVVNIKDPHSESSKLAANAGRVFADKAPIN
jgi:hypothetical protein